MKKKCIFPGTFDPFTNGHLDIIKRSLKIFDEITVLLLINKKKTTLFTTEQRLSFVRKALSDTGGITVDSYDGLLTEYCDKTNCCNVIRGIRNGVDFEYEMQYFGINRMLRPDIEMFFLPTSRENLYTSSSNARELIAHRRSAEGLVPSSILPDIKEIFKY